MNIIERARAARNNESGFTLIELLIVIVILGVLSAIVVFSVTGINNNSKVAACKTDVKAIDSAAEAYYAQNNAAVGSLKALATAGFLHDDASIAANTKTTTSYTVTFTPGSGAAAGDATSATCP